jgi:hypothetical protein
MMDKNKIIPSKISLKKIEFMYLIIFYWFVYLIYYKNVED